MATDTTDTSVKKIEYPLLGSDEEIKANPLDLTYEFRDPFLTPKKYDGKTVGRVTFDIPRDVHNMFYRLLPYKSAAVFQTTFTILTHKLLKHLKAHGYKFNSDEGDMFKQFICGLEFEIGPTPEPAYPDRPIASGHSGPHIQRNPPSGVVSETLPPDDSGRKNGTSGGDTGAENKQPDIPGETSRASKRGTGGRGGRKAGKTAKSEGSEKATGAE